MDARRLCFNPGLTQPLATVSLSPDSHLIYETETVSGGPENSRSWTCRAADTLSDKADMGNDRIGHNDGLCRALPVACRKHRDSMVETVTGDGVSSPPAGPWTPTEPTFLDEHPRSDSYTTVKSFSFRNLLFPHLYRENPSWGV